MGLGFMLYKLIVRVRHYMSVALEKWGGVLFSFGFLFCFF